MGYTAEYMVVAVMNEKLAYFFPQIYKLKEKQDKSAELIQSKEC